MARLVISCGDKETRKVRGYDGSDADQSKLSQASPLFGPQTNGGPIIGLYAT